MTIYQLEVTALERIIELLKLLGDPTRMKMFKFLQKGDVYVCELGEVLRISQPTISQHIRRFKQLGLVREQRRGQKVCYSLDASVFQQLQQDLVLLLETDISQLDCLSGEWQRMQDSQLQACILECKQSGKIQ